MKDRFRQEIIKEFARAGDGTADLRKAAYMRLRKAIARKAVRPDGTMDEARLRLWMGAFEEACREVEDDYQGPDLSDLEGDNRVRSTLSGLSAIAASAVVIGTAIDFFSVILNDALGLSAMAVYMLAGLASAAVLAVMMRIPSLASLAGGMRTAFRAAVAIALVGGIALGLTFTSPEARERGLIAALVPGAAEAQDNLLGRLERTAQETAEATKRIEEKVATLKKETSDDPCKELVNLGYACNSDSLDRALHDGNARVVRLYMESGQPVPSQTMMAFLSPPFGLPEPLLAELGDILLSGPEAVDRKVCLSKDVVAFWRQENFLLDPATPPVLLEFFNKLCGKEALRAEYAKKRETLEARQNGYEAAMTEFGKAVETCASTIVNKHQAAIAGADEFNAGNLLETAWNDGFELALKSGAQGELGMFMIDALTAQRVSNMETINALRFEGVDLRQRLPDFARGGCEFGMTKPAKPLPEEFERVDKILAVIDAH